MHPLCIPYQSIIGRMLSQCEGKGAPQSKATSSLPLRRHQLQPWQPSCPARSLRLLIREGGTAARGARSLSRSRRSNRPHGNLQQLPSQRCDSGPGTGLLFCMAVGPGRLGGQKQVHRTQVLLIPTRNSSLSHSHRLAFCSSVCAGPRTGGLPPPQWRGHPSVGARAPRAD